MDVQQIERIPFRDLGHARSQGQTIRGELKQRVGRDFHLVGMDARESSVQANRVGVSDEVHLVATGGELHPQFGGDNSAAAIGGIAGDSDLHFDRLAPTGSRVASPI